MAQKAVPIPGHDSTDSDNGLILEELHPPIKAELESLQTDQWSAALPTLLLGSGPSQRGSTSTTAELDIWHVAKIRRRIFFLIQTPESITQSNSSGRT
ncbi:hypothetical protein HNY73_003286 [Argiope bruennichi]|uniref:Uncharacterized protein n=1 Tax=Argiope bruennichi TaxID=94029 RepID=A0A8T0G0T3_ARGBR|nr:hypothetical protein HNY73_003286 [Argiope bruennichi]